MPITLTTRAARPARSDPAPKPTRIGRPPKNITAAFTNKFRNLSFSLPVIELDDNQARAPRPRSSPCLPLPSGQVRRRLGRMHS